MKASPAARRDDRGFTLVELLIVIVILGVLATITVFAVRGITNQGQSSACASDKKNIETAEEANMAQTGSYASEAALVTNGLLHEQSSNIDVTVGTDTAGKPAYTVSNVGTCAGGGATTTAAPGATTTTAPGVTTTLPGGPVLFPSSNRIIVGSGAPIVAVVGYGPAANAVVQSWKSAMLATFPSGPSSARYVVIDTSGTTNINSTQFNEFIQATYVIWVNGNNTIIGGPLEPQVAPTLLGGLIGSRVATVTDQSGLLAALTTWNVAL